MTINTIQLIVHPGYHQLPKDKKTIMPKNAESHFLLKQTFNTIGQTVLDASKNKNTIVIFVPAQNIPQSRELQKEQERFSNWANKQLGERFVNLPSEFGSSSQKTESSLIESFKPIKPAIARLKGRKFGPIVKINASGEYRNQCVITAKDRLTIALQGIGVKKVMSNISKTTLSYEQAQKTHTNILFRKKYTDYVKWRRETFGKRKTNKPKKRTLKK